jgi:hypothetical protein
MFYYLKQHKIEIDFCILNDNFIYGYQGTQYTRLNQVIYSNKYNKISSYLKKETFSDLAVIVSSDVYNELNTDLQILCFPYEITDHNIYYKVYNNVLPQHEDNSSIISLKHDNEALNKEFNIERIVEIKNLISKLANDDFDSLIDYIFVNNTLTSHVNLTMKSLTKLAFHQLISEDYMKVLEILDDIFILINQEGTYDKDFYCKMKQLKETIQQKVIIKQI